MAEQLSVLQADQQVAATQSDSALMQPVQTEENWIRADQTTSSWIYDQTTSSWTKDQTTSSWTNSCEMRNEVCRSEE